MLDRPTVYVVENADLLRKNNSDYTEYNYHYYDTKNKSGWLYYTRWGWFIGAIFLLIWLFCIYYINKIGDMYGWRDFWEWWVFTVEIFLSYICITKHPEPVKNFNNHWYLNGGTGQVNNNTTNNNIYNNPPPIVEEGPQPPVEGERPVQEAPPVQDAPPEQLYENDENSEEEE